MRRLVNADRKEKGNNLENNVNVFNGHSLSAKSLALIVTNPNCLAAWMGETSSKSHETQKLLDGASTLLGSLGRDGFNLDCLGWNAADHMKRWHVFRCHTNRTHESVFGDTHAAQYRCVICNAGFRAEFSFVIGDNHAVGPVVRVSVHIGVIGNRAARVNDELSAMLH